jgi:hypothetical protein
MRALQKDFIPLVNILYRSCHFLLHRIVFLQHQSARIFLRHPVVGHHADHVFASVVIVKERRVKPEVIERYGFRPRPCDIRRRYEVVLRVIHIAVKRPDNRIKKVKGPLIISKTWRPYSLGGPHAPKVQLGYAV